MLNNKKLFGIFVVFIVILFDQTSKCCILDMFGKYNCDSFVIVANVLHFTFVKNAGVSFGLFSDNFFIVTIINFILLSFIIVYLIKKEFSIGLYIMLGGGIGNFIDRIFREFVIDFIDFNFFGIDFPCFNIADIAISLGILIYLVSIRFGFRN